MRVGGTTATEPQIFVVSKLFYKRFTNMKLHKNNISNIQAEVFWAFGNQNKDRTGDANN